ncbi:MAG: hypothetical protein CMG07_05515 [Candidatus Marinimicrobia bacterium]|nr:hypothetical protein [Candidatus Neomarinimicrobiota bacterium]
MVDLNSLNSFISELSSNPYLVPFIISMLPVVELRLAIPYGVLVQKLEWTNVMLISSLGNYLAAILVFLFIKYLSEYFMKYKIFSLILDWIFKRTRKKGSRIEKYKLYGLILFVGIPLPLTGAWTGCIASYLFNISVKNTLLGTFLGICMSALIVTTLTLLGKLSF